MIVIWYLIFVGVFSATSWMQMCGVLLYAGSTTLSWDPNRKEGFILQLDDFIGRIAAHNPDEGMKLNLPGRDILLGHDNFLQTGTHRLACHVVD
jgi:hypothetical protein